VSVSKYDGSTSAAVTSSVTWEAGWELPHCHLFVEFATSASPELSILAYGDSVINQWKIWDDTKALIRDGWQWRLETSADTNGKKYHVATAGNGGYALSEFAPKLSATFNMYKDWIDIIMFEGWTPNSAPVNDSQRLANEALISSLHTLVTSAGKDWLMIYPSPIGAALDQGTSAEQKLQQANTIAWGTSAYPGRIIDGRPGVWDPANHDSFLVPTLSKDNTHQTDAGAIAFAAYIKPILETTLTNLGKEI